MRFRRWAALIALMVAVALVVAACADDASTGDTASGDDRVTADAADDAGSDATSDDATADDDATTDGATGDDNAANDTDDATAAALADELDRSDDDAFAIAQEPPDPEDHVPTALTPADIGRDIAFRAEMEVEVADVAAASAEAAQRIRALGGIVFGQVTITDPEPRTVLTFKVLPADFDAALSELAGVGAVTGQSISADDVTDRVVDLESRIATSAASVLRLRDLLDDAGDVSIIAQLENQLLERETTLEQLRGQLRTLRDQVALATITVTITQSATVVPPAGLVVDAWLGVDADDACPGSSELEIGETESAVLCVEVENVGEAALAEVEIESEALRLRTGDFEIDSGDGAELAPGERLVATLRLDVDDGRVRRREVGSGLLIDVVATASPDGAGVGAPVQHRSEVLLVVETDDEPLPGFGDALGGGLDALGLVGSILLIGVGLILPFVPIVAIIAGGAWLWLRRRPGTAEVDPDLF